MSYTSLPSINESREGQTYIGEDQVLLVEFMYHEWSEGHPYSDRTAYERLWETESETYYLDDEPISYSRLVSQFGKEAVDQGIRAAIESTQE